MKKKIFSLLLAIVLLGTLFVPAMASDVETFEAMELNAINAYSEILNHFPVGADGIRIYPDDFGDAYYEDGYLHVNLKELTVSKEALYRSYCSDPSLVVFHDVNYGYNELTGLAEQILENGVDNFTTIGVNVYDNLVEIGIDETVVTSSRRSSAAVLTTAKNEIIEKLNIPSAYASKEASIPISVVSQKPLTSQSTLRGGDGIYDSYGSYGTMAICGTWDGEPAILTAGHVVDAISTCYYGSSSGPEIGSALYMQYESGENYDWGVYSADNHTLTPRVLNNYGYESITHTLTASDELVGSNIRKYGESSQYSTGKITKKNVSVSDEGFITKGMTLCECYSEDGDSGAPVYAFNCLKGILSAGNGVEMAYSPIYGVSSRFVVQLYS